MRVLLSIKPEFAEKIFDGTKRFEYRRSIFKNKNVQTVVVYASSPVKRVIGEFQIEEILSADLDELWENTQLYAGIDQSFFYSYFEDKETGFAIKICNAHRYQETLCIREHFNAIPPQSFLYLD